jgi:hypothetical protein
MPPRRPSVWSVVHRLALQSRCCWARSWTCPFACCLRTSVLSWRCYPYSSSMSLGLRLPIFVVYLFNLFISFFYLFKLFLYFFIHLFIEFIYLFIYWCDIDFIDSIFVLSIPFFYSRVRQSVDFDPNMSSTADPIFREKSQVMIDNLHNLAHEKMKLENLAQKDRTRIKEAKRQIYVDMDETSLKNKLQVFTGFLSSSLLTVSSLLRTFLVVCFILSCIFVLIVLSYCYLELFCS